MGLGSRELLASRLLARGWAPTTPAAVLLGISTAAEQLWRGTLEDLGVASWPDAGQPGTLVIGEVVALARAGARPASAAEAALAP